MAAAGRWPGVPPPGGGGHGPLRRRDGPWGGRQAGSHHAASGRWLASQAASAAAACRPVMVPQCGLSPSTSVAGCASGCASRSASRSGSQGGSGGRFPLRGASPREGNCPEPLWGLAKVDFPASSLGNFDNASVVSSCVSCVFPSGTWREIGRSLSEREFFGIISRERVRLFRGLPPPPAMGAPSPCPPHLLTGCGGLPQPGG